MSTVNKVQSRNNNNNNNNNNNIKLICIIVKIHENNKPNMNTIIKVAEQVAEELNQTNESSDTKEEGIQCTYERLGESLKKIGMQSDALAIY